MIVQCENCGTKFRFPQEQMGADGAWVRCSNCQHVFQISPPEPAAPQAEPAPASSPLEEDLLLDGGDQAGDQDLGDTLVDFDLEGEPEKSGGGPGKFFKIVFWLVGLLVLLAVLLAGGLVAMQRLGMGQGVLERVRDLPGVSLLLSRLGGQPVQQPEPIRVTLINVRGYFRVNDKVGRIFIIQGLVENQHQNTRTEILVRGLLQNRQGKPAREAVVYAGTVFTPEELRTLSLEEMQARLGSPRGPDGKPYTVEPRGTIPFMVVFAHLPDDLAEYTAEVVSTKPLLAANPAGK